MSLNTQEYIEALETFYKNYILDTANGSVQIFQSFTYGEMVISILLTVLVLMYALKWLWEVVR